MAWKKSRKKKEEKREMELSRVLALPFLYLLIKLNVDGS